MKVYVDWKATIALTAVLLLASIGLSFAMFAVSTPVVFVPLLLVGGLVLISVGKKGPKRERMRGLLRQQKDIVKSFISCLCSSEEHPPDSHGTCGTSCSATTNISAREEDQRP